MMMMMMISLSTPSKGDSVTNTNNICRLTPTCVIRFPPNFA